MSTDEIVVTLAMLEAAISAIHVTGNDGQAVTFDRTFAESVFMELQRAATKSEQDV
jgi:hypothetical protein